MPSALDYRETGDAPEYKVYVYHPDRKTAGRHHWERRRTTVNRLRAIAEAQKLHDTQQYSKIEIKKTCYDERRQCDVDTTIKIFEQNPGTGKMKRAIAATLLFVAASAVFFAIL